MSLQDLCAPSFLGSLWDLVKIWGDVEIEIENLQVKLLHKAFNKTGHMLRVKFVVIEKAFGLHACMRARPEMHYYYYY